MTYKLPNISTPLGLPKKRKWKQSANLQEWNLIRKMSKQGRDTIAIAEATGIAPEKISYYSLHTPHEPRLKVIPKVAPPTNTELLSRKLK
jgi:hypothetical protein